MNITEQLNNLLSTVINIMIIPILPVLTAFIIAYIKRKTSELEAGMKSAELTRYTRLAEDAVVTAVTAVNQVFVDSIKQRNSTLTPYEQKAAFGMAKERSLKIIGDNGVKILKSLYKDFDTWLENRIEYYVNICKKCAMQGNSINSIPATNFGPEHNGGVGGEP